MKKLFSRYDLLITLLLFLLVIPAGQSNFFPGLENYTLSWRHQLRQIYGDQEKMTFPSDKILLVNTDEEFFKEYESWPLRRTDIGKIALNLRKLGAKVVALDILMDFPNSYGEDPLLAKQLKEAGNILVVSQAVFNQGKFEKLNYPTDEIAKVTTSAYSNHPFIGDTLSRVRVYPEIIKERDGWPFAISALAMYFGVEPKLDGKKLIIGNIIFNLDQRNDILVDFPRLAPDEEFISATAGLSAMEFLEMDDLDEEEIEELRLFVKDKLVLIGDTSVVSHDIFVTPAGEVYGVEILADTLHTLLKGAPLKSASLTQEILVTVTMFLLLIGLIFIDSPLWRSCLFLLLAVLYIGLESLAYVKFDLSFSMSYPFLAFFWGYFLINLCLYLEERKQKAFIREAFSQYLSPSVIEVIEKDPTKLSLGGEKRLMTAMFSDVQKFSTISESLTPEELVTLLNEYLTEMCQIIANYDGTVDKFEGDAIIAFWGAPLTQEDHAIRACHAAIDMRYSQEEMNSRLIAERRPPLYTRIGLNSGDMVVGNMGSQQRMDYTIMGDSVNLAARLEGANKFYSSYQMISDSTYYLAKEQIDVRELDTIKVVGKNEPITVYELLDKKNRLKGQLAGAVDHYAQGMEYYKKLDFKKALTCFETALSYIPTDGPSINMIERCQSFIEQSPEKDWDGVYRLTSKG